MSEGAVRAYDDLAPRYDSVEAGNRILRYLRAQSLDALLAEMPRGGRLLELGTGAGTEAIGVSRALRAQVVGVEPSQELAAVCRAKADPREVQLELRTCGALEAIRQLEKEGATFDGAWSSFALAYERPLAQLRPLLAGVLKPGAPFVCSLRNPWCACEPWSIPWRRTQRYRHKVGRAHVPLLHYSVRQAAEAMSPEFALARFSGMAVLVPPPRYGAAWNRLGAVADRIERLDARIATRSPTNALGDHTLFRFRRK